MCRFLETIRVEKGVALHLSYHQNRLDRTFARFFPGAEIPSLEEAIHLPEGSNDNTLKCRVIYDRKIREINHQPYHEKIVRTLKLVKAGDLEYAFKSANRAAIDELMKLREGCDDVLIERNGYVTDSSYCNILFFDGSKWLTPDKPLLRGTTRQRLIDEQRINEARITVNDLGLFEKFMLVNAMLDFELQRAREMSGIRV